MCCKCHGMLAMSSVCFRSVHTGQRSCRREALGNKLHLLVLDDAAFLKVNQEDVAGHQAPLGGNVPVGDIHHAHLTCHDLPFSRRTSSQYFMQRMNRSSLAEDMPLNCRIDRSSTSALAIIAYSMTYMYAMQHSARCQGAGLLGVKESGVYSEGFNIRVRQR